MINEGWHKSLHFDLGSYRNDFFISKWFWVLRITFKWISERIKTTNLYLRLRSTKSWLKAASWRTTWSGNRRRTWARRRETRWRANLDGVKRIFYFLISVSWSPNKPTRDEIASLLLSWDSRCWTPGSCLRNNLPSGIRGVIHNQPNLWRNSNVLRFF